MMRPRSRFSWAYMWCPVFLLMACLTGCGASENQKIADALTQWHHDIAAGDMTKACELMTDSAKKGITDATQAADCPGALTLLAGAFTPSDRTAFANATVDSAAVTIQGPDAMVAENAVHYQTQPADWAALRGPVPFHNDQGLWKIASVIQ